MKPSSPDNDSSTKTHQNHVTDGITSLNNHNSDGINGIGPEQAFSFSSGATPEQIFDEDESTSVSQAGDIGDRAIHSNRCSESGTLQLSVDDPLIQIENGFPEKIVSPLAMDAIHYPRDKDQSRSVSQPVQDNKRLFPPWFEYVSYLIHLAVFGILGVLTRYLLRELFGPGIVDLSSDQTILYADLPSNMVGSFLMGWLGVVFKGDIFQVSDILAIALTTGYLGSLTTFSGWNQKMLQLCVKGHWVLAVIGFFIGTVLVAGLITLGVETAKVFRLLLGKHSSNLGNDKPKSNWRVNSFKKHLVVLVVLVLMLSLLWGFSGSLLRRQFDDGGTSAQLWFACMVAPPGVWLRWYLARLNGRGLSRNGLLSWMPFGTLIANVLAACVMAALATVMDVVNTQKCDTIAIGIQFGFLGCLSTVSTFMAEFHAMRNSSRPWRAYAYALTTLLASFVLGSLLYTLPVLTKGYE